MKINFVSLFSGIEAASVAMSRIPDAEWSPVFFSEIDPYANALLAHRFPHVPNLGDICKIRADIQKGTITNGRTTLPFPDGGIHLLCGGSPCQDVSTAGLRRGMEENSATRSSLAFEYLRLVDELRPRCILWENVAGVLSSRRGLDFRDFLRRLVELGFGVAWRVLDCQYTRSDSFPRAIPQRRRRVFLLGLRTGGHSGTDAVRAAEILLERNGVLGNPETEREEGQALAAPAGYGPLRANRDFAEGFGESGPGYWLRGGQSQTLRARDRPTFPSQVAVYPYAQFGGYNADGGASSTVNATDSKHLTDLVVTNGGGCVGFDANLSQNAVLADGAADMLTVCHRSAVCLPPPPEGNRLPVVRWTVRTRGRGADRADNHQLGRTRASGSRLLVYPIDTMNALARENSENGGTGIGPEGGPQFTLSTAHHHAVAVGISFDGRKDAPLLPGCAHTQTVGTNAGYKDGVAVFKIRGGRETYTKPDGKTGTAGKGLLMSDEAAFTVSVAQDQQLLDGGFVRRLTPTECETLQGFPRGWTDVPVRGKPASDAARFKGLGNSWATNCAEWILRRLVASDVFKE